MDIDTAVGEIRTYYLNLPEDDLTEGGRFTAEVLEKLVATERAKVLSEVDGWLDEMPIYMETDGYSGDKPSFAPFRAELRAKLNQLKGNHE